MFEMQIGHTTGKLKHFIIEPFLSHENADEMYICIYSNREGEVILFHHEGGIDIGDVDSKALQYLVAIDDPFDNKTMENTLLKNVPNDRRTYVCKSESFHFIEYFVPISDFYQNLFLNYMPFTWIYNLRT